MKEVFDVNQIDLQKAGRSFGFTVPPKVNISNFKSVRYWVFRC